MTDRIVLTGLTFEARHGVNPSEKERPQRFEVDVELELGLAAAGSSDDLAETVDYAAVATFVRAVLDGPPVALIETLAERIATGLLERFTRLDAVVVRVRKPEVRLAAPVAHAGVEIRRTSR